MNRKQKWRLILIIALPLLLLTGYQIKENYTITLDRISLYSPSNTTITDKIQHIAYDTPTFRPNKSQPHTRKRDLPNKPIQYFIVSPFRLVQPNKQSTRTHRIQENHGKAPISVKKPTTKTHSDQQAYSKDPIWETLNPLYARTPLNGNRLLKQTTKKETKKKPKPSPTIYSTMNEVTPDIEANLGYTNKKNDQD